MGMMHHVQMLLAPFTDTNDRTLVTAVSMKVAVSAWIGSDMYAIIPLQHCSLKCT